MTAWRTGVLVFILLIAGGLTLAGVISGGSKDIPKKASMPVSATGAKPAVPALAIRSFDASSKRGERQLAVKFTTSTDALMVDAVYPAKLTIDFGDGSSSEFTLTKPSVLPGFGMVLALPTMAEHAYLPGKYIAKAKLTDALSRVQVGTGIPILVSEAYEAGEPNVLTLDPDKEVTMREVTLPRKGEWSRLVVLPAGIARARYVTFPDVTVDMKFFNGDVAKLIAGEPSTKIASGERRFHVRAEQDNVKLVIYLSRY